MVTARFPGVEVDQSSTSPEGQGTNPTAEAGNEVLGSLSEAHLPHELDIENWQRIAGFGIGITSLLIEDFLTHPFVVIRRQCMVNSSAALYHLAPFSVCRIMTQIKRKQGLSTFWKGQGSRLAVRGMNLMAELIISEVTKEQLPREVNKKSNLGELAGHILGKSLSIVFTLPFYTASIAETVQTEQIDVQSGPFSFVKEGLFRLVGWQLSSKGHGRLLPLWSLILPTVLHSLLHYLITSCLQQLILIRRKKKGIFNAGSTTSSDNAPTRSRQMTEAYFPELMASLTSTVLTEIALYPLETVLYRLHLQGTRTMIDDTDNGYAVVSLCTNYEGLFDCFSRIKMEEGLAGFYKGFGALFLQYVLQLAVLRLTKSVYLAISEDFKGEDGTAVTK